MKKFFIITAILFAGCFSVFAQSKQVFRYATTDNRLIVDVSEYGNTIFVSTNLGVNGTLQRVQSYNESLFYMDTEGDYINLTNSCMVMIFGDYNTKQSITLFFVSDYWINN